jgi:hypothetical protein
MTQVDQLEREAQEHRRLLGVTLGELKANLAPRRLAQEFLGYLRAAGAATVRGLAGAARRRPLSTALAAGFAVVAGSGRVRSQLRRGLPMLARSRRKAGSRRKPRKSR